jgi:protein gp37
MAKNTEIEWCDSTHNLQMGCDGCELWNPKAGVEHCYAGTLHARWAGKNKGWPESFDKPKLFLNRLDEMLRWSDLTGTDRPDKPWLNGLPRMIFLNDLGDTFTESLPLDWLAPILPQLAESPHQYMILTKRSKRIRDFASQFPLPTNVWPGVSVTSAANVSRIADLLAISSGGPKWVSAEPLLSAIDLSQLVCGNASGNPLTKWSCSHSSHDSTRVEELCESSIGHQHAIKLVIVGGESGPDARPCATDWIRSLKVQCQAASVAFFVKQLGRNPLWNDQEIAWTAYEIFGDKKGGNPNEWPSDLRVREFPELEVTP